MGLGAAVGGLRVFIKKNQSERDWQPLQHSRPFHRWGGRGLLVREAGIGLLLWARWYGDQPTPPLFTSSFLIVFNNAVLFAFVLPCECNIPEGPVKDGAFCSSRMARHLACSNTWESENKSPLCPLLLYFLAPFPWLFDSTCVVIWRYGRTRTGGAGVARGSSQSIPGTAEAPPHLSARSPCRAGTLYTATGWAAFQWPGQAVQVTALTSQQDLPVQGFMAFSSPSGRTRSPARAL